MESSHPLIASVVIPFMALLRFSAVTSEASEGGNDNSRARAADKNDCTLPGRECADRGNCRPLLYRSSINTAAVPLLFGHCRYAARLEIRAILLFRYS